MAVETNANFISDLNKAYPRNQDLIKEGDDHIRLIKSTLQNTFPGIDKALKPDADKINKLHSTFTYDSDTLKINNSTTFDDDLELDFGGNKLTNVGDPEDEMDVVNLRSLQGSLMWPIGSIFMTVDSRNPNAILGFGKWEKFAEGRVIVGTGSTTDSNNEFRTVVNESKGGAYAVTLSTDQLPTHTHEAEVEIEEGGFHSHQLYSGGGSSGPRNAISIDAPYKEGHDFRGNGGSGDPRTEHGGGHDHKGKITIKESGKGKKFDIIPPFMACNIWVRKADT